MMNAVEVAARSPTAGAGGAILVIDDDFAIREVLTDILLALLPEIFVYTAANGHEGVQLFQKDWQRISLIMLDMNMPVMNGEQTYEKLQQIAPDVRVIVSSSLSENEARLRFKEQALPTYLRKPYSSDTLLRVVKTALAFA